MPRRIALTDGIRPLNVETMPTELSPEDQREYATTTLTVEEQLEFLGYMRGLREQAEEAAAKPKPEPKPEKPAVKTEDVEVFVGWTYRLNSWCLRNFGLGSQDGVHDSTGRRLWLHRKTLVWAILAYPRLRRMLSIVFSGPAGDYVAETRNGICEKCPSRKVDRKGYWRCGSCRCPDWFLSRLRFKNRRRRNHCPEKLHPGEYIKLVTHTYPNRKKPEAAKPVTVGCGGKRNG